MYRRFWSALGVSLMVAGLALTACSPKYPKCDKDENCQEKGEVCVNGQCQECRDQEQCTAKYPNEKRECNNGRCDVKPECRADTDCASVGPGLVCRSSKCVPECSQDTDCGSGKKCVDQKCQAECAQDVDCGPNRSCLNGQCQDADPHASKISSNCRPLDPSSGDLVNLEMVHFEFNKYDLTQDAKDQLSKLIECLKQAPPNLKIIMEGHCDDRGTQEYNLALGEKRAHNVLQYLKRLGVETKRFSVRSKGENEPLCTTPDESCWSKNRRVQFIQKQ